MPHARLGARISRFWRALRSGVFFLIYALYLTAIIGLGQRLFLWPAITIVPRRRRALVRAWLRGHARVTLGLARVLANVRLTVRGAIPPDSCIVVMNHQSVLDIPLGLDLVPGPYPLIPTRDRYRRWIPGISPLARLARYPFVSQKRTLARAELAALTDAADQVARGEQSLLIFPEGHRTRDGQIGRFMRPGLRIILSRAARPIYCIVADGMAESRTTLDALFRFADTRINVTILGPFPPPADEGAIDPFIDSLHAQMTAALAQLRSSTSRAHRAEPASRLPR
ncbi:MAG: 1-acyl-sn-glycerol-3-phosphate acyltransferase [Gemmatimonadaceae bacterium]|nr:1-acyl-sn-glycerol-3-phosphate acyltransferase [Gemmatimonadaceae bacterium]